MSKTMDEKTLTEAAAIIRNAKIMHRRGTRNWVRGNEGDEIMARRYWDQAAVLFERARNMIPDPPAHMFDMYDHLVKTVTI